MAWHEIVEERLCFAWVDSLPGSKDFARSILRTAPRKPGANRSKANTARGVLEWIFDA